VGHMMFNVQIFLGALPEFLAGALVATYISCAAALLGCVGGILLTLGYSAHVVIRRISAVYVSVIQGTPMLLQVSLMFYALPHAGVRLSPVASAIIALGLNSAAYLSQVFLTGLRAVDSREVEAARALGMSEVQIWRFLRWPQIWRASLPALSNEMATLIKDSSLASVIGVVELTKVGNQIRGRTLDPWTSLLGVCIFYFALTLASRGCFKLVSQRSGVKCFA